MDPYSRAAYGGYRDDYPPPRRDPRSFDRHPQGSYAPSPQVDYHRPAERIYPAAPAVSYSAPPSNRGVEIRYYDPDLGPPVPMPYQPAPAPTAAPAPPMQIHMPAGPGSQFTPGQLYKVVGVEETRLYHSAPPPPPQPRTDYVTYDYGYPSVPRGPPTRRPYYQQY